MPQRAAEEKSGNTTYPVTFFFGVLRRAYIILFEDGDHLNPQAAISGVALDLLKAFGNLN